MDYLDAKEGMTTRMATGMADGRRFLVLVQSSPGVEGVRVVVLDRRHCELVALYCERWGVD